MIRLLLALVLSGTFLPAKKKPNILFLFADDQRADTIAAHGNPHIQTPHLDRLAREGFSFRKNYCAGSFSGAVCVASRAMLMTGQHWMTLPREKPQANWGSNQTLPVLLKKVETTSLSSSANGTMERKPWISLFPMDDPFIWEAWRITLISMCRT